MTLKKNGSDSVVTLKLVAEKVHLSPGTVSAVLNSSPSAKHIPEATRSRIFEAARELKYKPNLMARSLRNKRTYTIGVIPTDISDGYGGQVIAGIEEWRSTVPYTHMIFTATPAGMRTAQTTPWLERFAREVIPHFKQQPA